MGLQVSNMTGVTKETYKRLLIDAGAIYLNFGLPDQTILSATSGGNEYNVEREYFVPAIDNVKGNVAGTRTLVSEIARITANCVELTTKVLLAALPGSVAQESGDDPDYEEITSSGIILMSDYIKNVALVGRVSENGQPFVGIIENAMNTGGLSIKTQNRNNAVVAITFESHYDPDDASKAPWKIIKPKDAVAAGSGSGS